MPQFKAVLGDVHLDGTVTTHHPMIKKLSLSLLSLRKLCAAPEKPRALLPAFAPNPREKAWGRLLSDVFFFLTCLLVIFRKFFGWNLEACWNFRLNHDWTILDLNWLTLDWDGYPRPTQQAKGTAKADDKATPKAEKTEKKAEKPAEKKPETRLQSQKQNIWKKCINDVSTMLMISAAEAIESSICQMFTGLNGQRMSIISYFPFAWSTKEKSPKAEPKPKAEAKTEKKPAEPKKAPAAPAPMANGGDLDAEIAALGHLDWNRDGNWQTQKRKQWSYEVDSIRSARPGKTPTKTWVEDILRCDVQSTQYKEHLKRFWDYAAVVVTWHAIIPSHL